MVPSMQISYPIYLQYGNGPPSASVDFSSEKRFANGQFYNIFLELFMPQSKLNFDIGNFMINVKLFSELGVFITSSRPAILTFSSSLLTKLRTLIMLPILLLGFLREEERLVIPMIERFKYHKARETMLKSVNITFSDNIQVYSSTLIFSAQLQGIRKMFKVFLFEKSFKIKKNDSLENEKFSLEDSPLLLLDLNISMNRVISDKPMDEFRGSFSLEDGKNKLDKKIE
ncbi:hypothetical protein PMAC_000050 [Pneumocystis sp. 'macacae']|nr:hypothetical protein PMAC_000050 [Pneumocystis sp. 'macacae']